MNLIHLRWICTGIKLEKMRLNGKITNKVFNFDVPKKKKAAKIENLPTNFNYNKYQEKKSAYKRRTIILNEIFMRSITDLMSKGEIAPDILGKGIEISRIQVADDFCSVNVYWFTNKTDLKSEDVQEILNASAGHLKHELSQLQIMSKVPVINFVKDKELFAYCNVENFLSQLSVPNDSKTPDDCETLTSQRSENQANDIISEQDESCKITIPEMRHDVLGLNHQFIMNKIKTSLKKIKHDEKLEKQDEVLPTKDSQIPLNTSIFMTNTDQKELFNDFLKMQKKNFKSKKKLSRKNYDDVHEVLAKLENDD